MMESYISQVGHQMLTVEFLVVTFSEFGLRSMDPMVTTICSISLVAQLGQPIGQLAISHLEPIRSRYGQVTQHSAQTAQMNVHLLK